MQDNRNEMFQIIDPEIYLNRSLKKKIKKMPVRQYFGCEDIIINTAARVHDNNRAPDDFSFA